MTEFLIEARSPITKLALKYPNGDIVGIDSSSGYPYAAWNINQMKFWDEDETGHKNIFEFQEMFKDNNFVIISVTLSFTHVTIVEKTVKTILKTIKC